MSLLRGAASHPLCLSLTCAEVNADNSLKLDALMDGAIGFKDVPLDQHVAEYRSTVGCVPELFPGQTCTKTTAAQSQGMAQLSFPWNYLCTFALMPSSHFFIGRF
jgi:hypothetical protein